MRQYTTLGYVLSYRRVSSGANEDNHQEEIVRLNAIVQHSDFVSQGQLHAINWRMISPS